MKRCHMYFFAWATILLGWLGFALAGGPVARILAQRFGGLVLRIGQGKFPDPALFVQHRLREALWLTTLVLLWMAAHWVLDGLMCRRSGAVRERWVAHGLAGFALLNFWVAAASHTALFWGVLGVGSGTENFMQFNFKRVLLEENRAPVRAVLVGSSQTRAEIDENLLNQRLGTNLWTTELHFPGSKAFDLLLIEPHLRRASPHFVICYFSEGYLYSGSQGETPPNFLTLAQVPDLWRRGAFRYLTGEEIGYGLLGDVLPLFRCREILGQRLLGFEAMNVRQSDYDASLAPDLNQRAREMASQFKVNAESEFQKLAMTDFVARCESAGCTVVLIAGGFNPVLGQQMNPDVRKDMTEFLNGLKARHPNVIVLPGDQLAMQTAADYDDLNHVNPDMQRRFTEALAGWLDLYLKAHTPLR